MAPAKKNSPDAAAAAAEIDARLAAVPEPMRSALQQLREMIAAAAPEAEEGISYALPAFRYRGRPLVSYGAASSHCALYVMSPAVMAAHADLVAPFDTSKGTIRFKPDQPLPSDLVTTLVRARLAETDAGRK
jgi:uncharacterized protein YdhG (YjbR/CyaY superfamily)